MSNDLIMKSSAAGFYVRRKCYWDFRVVLGGFMLLFAPYLGECCWGTEAPKHGDMTGDYDLLVNEELVLNCTLNSNQVRIKGQARNRPYTVNSSLLLFKKEKGSKIDPGLVTIIDNLTAQLRIPHAKTTDSGIYHCKVALPESVSELLVCSSQVTVGYPPKPIRNFKCISKYYRNLTCTWDIDQNRVQTKYTLYKTIYSIFTNYFDNPIYQQCPEETMNNTFCQWRQDTDPPFELKAKTFTFVVQGNNSLGYHNQTFVLKHYEIFVPSSPEALSVKEINKQNLSIHWSPPERVQNIGQPPLMYQMWLEEMIGEKERKIFDIGIDITSFTVFGLIPYMKYNISLRCRSKFANNTDMWSPFISVQTQTLSDVPYHVPDIIPEAYELHHYDGYRTVTLYWKPVSSRYFNGNNFQYHIKYSENTSPSYNMMPSSKVINTTSLSTTFPRLKENASYVFNLYTVNQEGISNIYKAIFVDKQEKIPDPPEDITAISHDLGHYQVSWKSPKQNSSSTVYYMMFWCASLKPWLNRCETPIQWLNTQLRDNNVTLNLSDSSTNFQFAVVAKTSTASSGMQWATCIVPLKAALGKIGNVIVEPKSSSTLKVIWRLECSAQKAVVQKFELDYCKVDKQMKCQESKKSIIIEDSSVENYELKNLHPFSNYSIIIRAYNLAGIASEDSDQKYQATLQGAPSDPPQNVQVLLYNNTALQVIWQDPKEPNGVITRYVLHYDRNIKIIFAKELQIPYSYIINGLNYYAPYNISLEACVNHHCSAASQAISVRTGVGVPGIMDPPRTETVNSTFVKVSWNQPLVPNGPIGYYEIFWKEANLWNASNQEDQTSITVYKKQSTLIEIKCSNVENGGVKYIFAIRAVNVVNGNMLIGPLSGETEIRACLLTQGVAMIVGVAIGGTLALACIMIMIYKFIKWMSDKIHQVKNITIRLPKGLDGQETNPLNNYENFKSGLGSRTLNNNNNMGRLSYIADDCDKNRHGSGSSQYSFSSNDELLYKNNKCIKFTRKPSSESSGCSSMSSTTTKNLSSDSSTESDFMTPPSPDLHTSDRGTYPGHKVNLPILIEDQDSSNSVPNDLVEITPECDDDKTSYISNGVVLKIDPPYSKLGFRNTVMPFWLPNTIAIYDSRIPGSELSVIDMKESLTPFIPYSKLGLSKNSSNILGLTQINSDTGYSKFGIITNSCIPSLQHQFDKASFYDKESKSEDTIKDLLEKYQYLNDTFVQSPNAINMGDIIDAPSTNVDLSNPIEKRLNEISEDNGYITFRRPSQKSTPVKSDYVPFNEFHNMSNFIPVSKSLLPDIQGHEASLEDVEIKILSVDGNPEETIPFNTSSDTEVFSAHKGNYIQELDLEFEKTDNGVLNKEIDIIDCSPKSVKKDRNTLEYDSNKVFNGSRNGSINLPNDFELYKMCANDTRTQSSETDITSDSKTFLKNGYVPISTLSNLNSQKMSSPEIASVPSTYEKSHFKDCDSFISKTLTDPGMSYVKKRTENSIHQVDPVPNSFLNNKCDVSHDKTPLVRTETCNGFYPQRFIKLGPVATESEICEV